DARRDGLDQFSQGTRNLDEGALGLHLDFIGYVDRQASDTAHKILYFTSQSTSPPTLAWNACRSVKSPLDVDTIRTAPASPRFEKASYGRYTLKPERETRLTP